MFDMTDNATLVVLRSSGDLCYGFFECLLWLLWVVMMQVGINMCSCVLRLYFLRG